MTETSTEGGTEQAAFPAPAPGEQHRWLEKLLGTWRYESPKHGSSEILEGTEIFTSIGGIWVHGVSNGPMPDGAMATSLVTLGYDPARERFVGTWLGSMMHHLWVYQGRLDDEERSLILDCDGPDFESPGRMRRYRDIITFESDDVRTLTGEIQGDDGEWNSLMQVRYTRV